jgi:hypothetical protein|tara:strand:- start:396 stop:641 length:246 start_codon:yes stop_codon:yes gene_type:complete
MNSLSKFEDKSLKQINVLNENLAKILLRLFGQSKTKKVFKQAAKVVAKDKNLQAALIDLQQANKRLKDHMKDYCKKYPDSC